TRDRVEEDGVMPPSPPALARPARGHARAESSRGPSIGRSSWRGAATRAARQLPAAWAGDSRPREAAGPHRGRVRGRRLPAEPRLAESEAVRPARDRRARPRHGEGPDRDLAHPPREEQNDVGPDLGGGRHPPRFRQGVRRAARGRRPGPRSRERFAPRVRDRPARGREARPNSPPRAEPDPRAADLRTRDRVTAPTAPPPLPLRDDRRVRAERGAPPRVPPRSATPHTSRSMS